MGLSGRAKNAYDPVMENEHAKRTTAQTVVLVLGIVFAVLAVIGLVTQNWAALIVWGIVAGIMIYFGGRKHPVASR